MPCIYPTGHCTGSQPTRFIGRYHDWSAIAFYEFLRGNDELGHQAYRQAERLLARLPGNQMRWSSFINAERANWSAIRGDLVAAERLLTHSINHLPVELRGEEARFRFRRTAIYLEWNQLENARADVEQVLVEIESFPPTYWWARGAELLWPACSGQPVSEIGRARFFSVFST